MLEKYTSYTSDKRVSTKALESWEAIAAEWKPNWMLHETQLEGHKKKAG